MCLMRGLIVCAGNAVHLRFVTNLATLFSERRAFFFCPLVGRSEACFLGCGLDEVIVLLVRGGGFEWF